MKLILLAATAMIATPLMAQTTPAPADAQTTMPAPADQSMTPAPADPAAAPADATTPPPAAPASQAGMQQPMTTGGSTPAGGYAPSGPAITGGTPGSTLPPVYRPAPTPDQAFPPPPAQAEYPICKKGQYDSCRQVSGGGHKMTKRRARR